MYDACAGAYVLLIYVQRTLATIPGDTCLCLYPVSQCKLSPVSSNRLSTKEFPSCLSSHPRDLVDSSARIQCPRSLFVEDLGLSCIQMHYHI
jgi:hypothetical protein